ncbi:hypothetical protein M0R72_14350 [Candidatus Pacearchaeota archaeon]|nr:hypothetical protein [Candidatus Pacearchaeota archaeon]
MVAPTGTRITEESIIWVQPTISLETPDVWHSCYSFCQVCKYSILPLPQPTTTTIHFGTWYELHDSRVKPDAVTKLLGWVTAHKCLRSDSWVTCGIIDTDGPYSPSAQQFQWQIVSRRPTTY